MSDAHQESKIDEQTDASTVNYPPWRIWIVSGLCGLGAGLAASLLAVVMMIILRLWLGIPTPVELFGDFVLKHLDVNTFVHLLVTYGPNAKTAPLGLALLGMIGLGVALGLFYAIIVCVKLPADGLRPARREWFTTLAILIGMTLVGVLLFWDELRQNFLGLPVNWARAISALGLLLDFTVYGVVLCLAYRAWLPRQASSGVSVSGRRQLLSRASVAALTVGGVGGTLGLVRGYLNNYASYDGQQTHLHNRVTLPITPNSEHYVVTQNTVDPAPDANLWQLEVTGLVKNPGSYNYAELQNLPSTSRAVTLECIANGVGHGLMSTAVWQGVTLRSLVERHGGSLPDAKYAAFYSVDGYNMSLPLDEVLEADALLAWRMNGAELPQRHGYPLRALIPGRYGEENPKWVTRVELTDHFVGGLYSDQGWYNGPLHTTSRIDHPFDTAQLGKTVEIGGIAFAGNRGIQKVEVSVDGATSWHETKLQQPLSQDAWVFWSWPWTPVLPGQYTLVCRATDGTGELQTSREQGTVPNGATGYDKVSIQVG
ncbi:MAG TPA: molybdopterin-dependent oxidoreductase [Ktedonobacteraceae bacterium]